MGSHHKCEKKERGAYHTLVTELREDNAMGRHRQYFRMNKESFDQLLVLVGPAIIKQVIVFREAIKPGLKLAVTLHRLAEGASHSCIAAHYRLGRSTISETIYDTCEGLYRILKPIYLSTPAS